MLDKYNYTTSMFSSNRQLTVIITGAHAIFGTGGYFGRTLQLYIAQGCNALPLAKRLIQRDHNKMTVQHVRMVFYEYVTDFCNRRPSQLQITLADVVVSRVVYTKLHFLETNML